MEYKYLIITIGGTSEEVIAKSFEEAIYKSGYFENEIHQIIRLYPV
jgi:hypothetical protein